MRRKVLLKSITYRNSKKEKVSEGTASLFPNKSTKIVTIKNESYIWLSNSETIIF